MSCLIDTETSTRWKKSEDQTAAMIQAATILRAELREMATNPPWNWRWTVFTQNNQEDAGQITNDQFQNDRVGWTISACSPPPSDPRLPFLPPQIKKNTWYSASRQKKSVFESNTTLLYLNYSMWMEAMWNWKTDLFCPLNVWSEQHTFTFCSWFSWTECMKWTTYILSVHDSPEQNQEFLALFPTKCPISSSLGLSFTVCKMIVPFKISFSSAVLSWQFFFSTI